MAKEQDARFVTDETFDFNVLSSSDSQEDENRDIPRGASGLWSPLSTSQMEEVVREANWVAAQLQQCHLPPRGMPPSPRSPRRQTYVIEDSSMPVLSPVPRSPHRQTFVVKDSPMRALLPTVESPPAATRSPPAKPQGPPAATKVPSTRKVPSSCHPPVVPKGPPGARAPPPSRMGPARPCPPQGQGAGTRGKAKPPRAGTAEAGSERGTGTTRGPKATPKPRQGVGGSGCPRLAPTPPLSPGQTKARGGTAPAPPATRQPCTRATAVPVPSGHPPAPSATPRAAGQTPAGRAAPGGRAPAPRGAGAARAAPPATGSGSKPGPPPNRLRPPWKTAMSSTPGDPPPRPPRSGVRVRTGGTRETKARGGGAELDPPRDEAEAQFGF